MTNKIFRTVLSMSVLVVLLGLLLFVVPVSGEEAQMYPRTMYVKDLSCKVRAGAGEEYELVGMMKEDEKVTVLEMVEGSGNRNWYKIDKKSLTKDMDISSEECYIRSDLLRPKLDKMKESEDKMFK